MKQTKKQITKKLIKIFKELEEVKINFFVDEDYYTEEINTYLDNAYCDLDNAINELEKGK